jgi:hypothetical protein
LGIDFVEITLDCEEQTTIVTEAEIVIDLDFYLGGEGNLTIDGNGTHRVFSVAPGVTAGLRGLIVTNGAAEAGGGIYNSGTLRVDRSTVSGSTADTGGGIYSDGTLTVTNSTVSGNASASGGGGIFNVGSGTLTHTSVSGNTIGGEPGDIRSTGTLTISRSLIDGGCVGESGGTRSHGYNLESPGNTCGFDEPTDIADVPAQALALGPLAENGGPTATHSLQEGSDAIDRVPPEACEVTEDQRGVERPQGDSCDVGAFER